MKQHPPKTSHASWTAQVKRLGLGNLASLLLQAGRPLAPMLAQLLYIADPFVAINENKNSLENLGAQLEDSQVFTNLIHELSEELK